MGFERISTETEIMHLPASAGDGSVLLIGRLPAVRQRSSSSTVLPVTTGARHHTVLTIETVLSVMGRLGELFSPTVPRPDAVELRTFCFLLLKFNTYPSAGA